MAAAFSKALGIEVDLTKAQMGMRCARGVFVIEDATVKSVDMEPAGKYEVSGVEACLLKLGYVRACEHVFRIGERIASRSCDGGPRGPDTQEGATRREGRTKASTRGPDPRRHQSCPHADETATKARHTDQTARREDTTRSTVDPHGATRGPEEDTRRSTVDPHGAAHTDQTAAKARQAKVGRRRHDRHDVTRRVRADQTVTNDPLAADPLVGPATACVDSVRRGTRDSSQLSSMTLWRPQWWLE